MTRGLEIGARRSTKLGYRILELRFVHSSVTLEHIGSDYVLLLPDRPQKGKNIR